MSESHAARSTPRMLRPHVIFGIASKNPPAQRQLASIVHHEDWLVCVAANQAADAAALAGCTTDRRNREATRMIDVAQKHTGDYMR